MSDLVTQVKERHRPDRKDHWVKFCTAGCGDWPCDAIRLAEALERCRFYGQQVVTHSTAAAPPTTPRTEDPHVREKREDDAIARGLLPPRTEEFQGATDAMGVVPEPTEEEGEELAPDDPGELPSEKRYE